jgi:multidrug efflux pump subunit AcrA (membrane-fusion protein)
VPADAVRGGTVFVIDGARVRKRDVKIGIRGTRSVEILSGLEEGERVASPAATELTDGARVRIIEMPSP